MIAFLEQLHSTIDEIFETKKSSEKIMFYAMPFLVLGFLSYQFITPMSEKNIAEKKQKRVELKTEIKTTQDYLARKPEILAEMKSISDTNKLLSVALQQKMSENTVLTNKIAMMDFINLDEKNVVDFLDNLALLSAKNRVSVLELTTSLQNKQNGVFKKEMRVDMNCSGDFNSLLGFANDVESAKMFTKIDNVRMISGKKINAELKINVSGL